MSSVNGLGQILKYTQSFEGTNCQLDMANLLALKDQIAEFASDSSASAYQGDEHVSSDSDIDVFLDSSHRIHVKVDNVSRRIRSVSDLPGVDKVLRYADDGGLSSGQKKLIRRFSEFAKNYNILWEGPFSCIARLSNASVHQNHGRLVADRPVPFYRPYLEPHWRLRYVTSFDLERQDGTKLYHITPSGDRRRGNISSRYIYLGLRRDSSEWSAESDVRQTHLVCQLEDEEKRRISLLIDNILGDIRRKKDIVQSMPDQFAAEVEMAIEWLKKVQEMLCAPDGEIPEREDDLSKMSAYMRQWHNAHGQPQHEGFMKTLFSYTRQIRVEISMTIPGFCDDDRDNGIEIGNTRDTISELLRITSISKQLETDVSYDTDLATVYQTNRKTFKVLRNAWRIAQDFDHFISISGLGNRNRAKPFLACIDTGEKKLARACFKNVHQKLVEGEKENESTLPGLSIYTVREVLGYIYTLGLKRTGVRSTRYTPVVKDGVIHYKYGDASIEIPLQLSWLDLLVGADVADVTDVGT